MFQVVNTHTVAELQFDARRVSGARNVLVFDPAFNESAEMRVLKALLTSAFAVPGDAAATTSGAPLPALPLALALALTLALTLTLALALALTLTLTLTLAMTLTLTLTLTLSTDH